MEQRLPSIAMFAQFADAGERDRERTGSVVSTHSHDSPSRPRSLRESHFNMQAPYMTPPNSNPTKFHQDLRAQDDMDPRDFPLLPEASPHNISTPLIHDAHFSDLQPPHSPPSPIHVDFKLPGPDVCSDARYHYSPDMVRAVNDHAFGRNVLRANSLQADKVQNYSDAKAFYVDPDFQARARDVSPPSWEDSSLVLRCLADKMPEIGHMHYQAARARKRTASLMASPPLGHAALAQPAKRLATSSPHQRALSYDHDYDHDIEMDDDEHDSFITVKPSFTAVAPTRHRRRSSANNNNTTKPQAPAAAKRRHSAGKRSDNNGIGKEAKSARAKSSKVQKSDDYLDYPDFAPALDSINRQMEPVKIEKPYTSNKADFSNDPERHLLCDEELAFAQSINLACRKYLCVKRQLFEEYVKWLRHESEHKGNWNKTRAQHMSNIDVTKTSLVFEFFRNAGWFDTHHFDRYMGSGVDLTPLYYKGPGST